MNIKKNQHRTAIAALLADLKTARVKTIATDDGELVLKCLPDSYCTIHTDCTHHLAPSLLPTTTFSTQTYSDTDCTQKWRCLRDRLQWGFV